MAAVVPVVDTETPDDDAYLVERGFAVETIRDVGWRLERLSTDDLRRYGLPSDAAGIRVWLIPYRHANGRVAFERLRLIDAEDIDRFRGKYRQPAGRKLALYDPFGVLDEPQDGVLLIEGEANAVAARVAMPGLSVLGLPGQTALTEEMARELGHIQQVWIWIDRHDKASEKNAQRMAQRLRAAGVEEVRQLEDTVELDANDALRELGADRFGVTLASLIDRAESLASIMDPPALDASTNGQSSLTEPASPSPSDEPGWPAPLKPEALRGLAGEVVATIGPHSEADPVALLTQFLLAFGNAAGRSAGFRAEADFHATNLYLVLVGQTAKGRKGSSWGQIGRVFKHADANWYQERVVSGASSGEGLIWNVRDPIVELKAQKEKGKIVGHEEQETDPGVSDKRLLDVESEFASVLRVMGRDGSTLSAMIRQAWDRGDLQVLTKNTPARARGAHISIVGHITCEELRRELGATDAANGFANRFLFACVRRSKALPEGGDLQDHEVEELAGRTREALRFASVAGEMRRDDAARRLWATVYEELSDGKPGLFGAVISRAEAQVMRLACLYALLDLSDVVRREHLESALALWTYCEQSALYIFGNALGDPLADRALAMICAAPGRELTRTELRDRFSRHQDATELERAIGLLERTGRVTRGSRPTAGRPIETVRAL